jgi:hypothetical protein
VASDRFAVVPWREYPADARPVLGVRYCTVCAVVGQMGAPYEHGVLL